MSDVVLRQIATAELIPRYPKKITANEIQENLKDRGYDITIRSVQRDLQQLSRIFPLMTDERSIPFGWSWSQSSPGHEFPSMDPVQALTFSLAAQYLEPLMPKANLKKIDEFFQRAEKVLLGDEKSNLSRWRKRVKVIPESIRFKLPNIKTEVRQKIYQAVYQGAKFKARYRKRGERKANSRLINPLGIVVKGSMTYLICMIDQDFDTPRYLPLQRFESVELLDAHSEDPPNFDLDEFIHESNLGFSFSKKLYYFEAIFDKTLAFHLLETPLNNTQTYRELADNKLLIKARVPDTLQFEQWLMSFGSDVEILKPAKLRKKFKDLSTKLTKMYKS